MADVLHIDDFKPKEGELCIEWSQTRFSDPWKVVGKAKEVLAQHGIVVRSLKHSAPNFMEPIEAAPPQGKE